jgi:hypothetical protein
MNMGFAAGVEEVAPTSKPWFFRFIVLKRREEDQE